MPGRKSRASQVCLGLVALSYPDINQETSWGGGGGTSGGLGIFSCTPAGQGPILYSMQDTAETLSETAGMNTEAHEVYNLEGKPCTVIGDMG